jgi:hypothetical protein
LPGDVGEDHACQKPAQVDVYDGFDLHEVI